MKMKTRSSNANGMLKYRFSSNFNLLLRSVAGNMADDGMALMESDGDNAS
jgi:hypothetical protein